LGTETVSIWATNGLQISGNYSVFLQGGEAGSGATISQTGLVPIGTDSILFEAQPGDGTLVVSLGGEDLSFFALSIQSNYTLYGAAIPVGFVGQSEQLEFSALSAMETGIYPNNWTLDNIQFSPSAVPEPSALGLSALGGLFVAWRRCRKPAQS
jgi:hypothetical protein